MRWDSAGDDMAHDAGNTELSNEHAPAAEDDHPMMAAE
jgi:hypothetical protein